MLLMYQPHHFRWQLIPYAYHPLCKKSCPSGSHEFIPLLPQTDALCSSMPQPWEKVSYALKKKVLACPNSAYSTALDEHLKHHRIQGDGANAGKRQYGGTVVSTAASQRQGPGFYSRLGSQSVEFAHSPRVCVGFLRVLRFPPTVQKMCS